MPQDIKDEEYMRYEEESEKVPLTEQEKWEKEQMSSGVYKFGVAKRQEKEEYDLLIDNQIEFLLNAKLPGTDDVRCCSIYSFLTNNLAFKPFFL